MTHKLLLLLTCCAVGVLGACAPEYSVGSRSGVIQKLSRKGILLKSYEGELVVGGWRSRSRSSTVDNTTRSSTVISNLFEFSVTSPDVADKLTQAMEQGAPVVIHYRQWLITPFWAQSTSYTVHRVEIAAGLGEPAQAPHGAIIGKAR